MMTDREKEIVAETGKIYNDFSDLFKEEGKQHNSDREEVVDAIHMLQSVIMRRIARRDCPDTFPMYN